jgi:D-alanine-D-alanine ligase
MQLNSLIEDQIHIAIVYSDPMPTLWERQKRQNYLYAEGVNINSQIESIVVENLRNDIEDEIQRARNALESRGKKVSVISVGMDLEDFVKKIRQISPTCVFNFFESSNGDSLQEMHFASVLEFLGLKYTGSRSFTLGLAVHKNLVKDMLSKYAIPTPDYWFVPLFDKIPKIPLFMFPLIVKPNREDASIGIDEDAIVSTPGQLLERVAFVHEQFKQPAMVERFINGRELNVSIIGGRELHILPISEIDYSEMPSHLHRIVTYEAKWAEKSLYFRSTKPICPAQLDYSIERKVKDVALAAFHKIGCRHYARVDLRLDAQENPYVLEVNPNPDISPDAGFPRSAAAEGIQYDDLINLISGLAMEEDL